MALAAAGPRACGASAHAVPSEAVPLVAEQAARRHACAAGRRPIAAELSRLQHLLSAIVAVRWAGNQTREWSYVFIST